MHRCKAVHKTLECDPSGPKVTLQMQTTSLLEMKMEICFVGPLGKVTGSCAWMRDGNRGWNFLVDCGMQQGEFGAQEWNSSRNWPFDPKALQFVVLTHAHIDHSGLIPLLYKLGFSGEVYCTKETAELAQLLLRDSAQFPEAPYDMSDVSRVKWRIHGGKTQLGKYLPVDDDLFLMFCRSGHILGATNVSIFWGAPGPDQRSIAFSGDVAPGAEDAEVLPFLRYSQHPKPANFAVLEATYGNVVRNAEERSPVFRRRRLQDLLDVILDSGGTLAIPAFSVGRIQDVMFDLHRIVAEHPDRYSGIAYYLDSQSAIEVNKITLAALSEMQITKHTGKVRPLWLGKQLFRELGLDGKDPMHLKQVLAICNMTLNGPEPVCTKFETGNAVARNWRALFSPVGNRCELIGTKEARPKVVLMTSGTCDGGPARKWLPQLATDDRNVIALSGYCAPATVGGQFLEIQNVSLQERQLLNKKIIWPGESQATLPLCDVKASICKLEGYSAHGDQADLVNWVFENHRGQIRQSMGKTVFLQHGGNAQRKSLKMALLERAEDWGLDVKVEIPDSASGWYDLDCRDAAGNRRVGRQEIEAQIRLLQKALVAAPSHRNNYDEISKIKYP